MRSAMRPRPACISACAANESACHRAPQASVEVVEATAYFVRQVLRDAPVSTTAPADLVELLSVHVEAQSQDGPCRALNPT